MPKAPQAKPVASNKDRFFVYKYEGKRVLAKRETCYRSAIRSCRSLFPSIPQNCRITFHTKDLDVCENELTMIPEDSWEFAISQLNTVVVETEVLGKPAMVAPASTDALGVLGGKPVIYLCSPTTLEASVKLSLAPQWNLSAIYPVVPIKSRTQTTYEEVSWKVKVHPNGDLTETTTGLDVAYLFWEAHTDSNVSRPPSPPPFPAIQNPSSENVDVFYPNSADLSDTNSVFLSIDKITPYLDKALAALCLHTEARTSFITYWLPSLLKHKHIALRFIPQAAYEHAAPLAVSPAPDVVKRVFMIFKGVTDEELGDWSSATSRAQEDVLWWKDVVGADCERAQDASLFRVLEWGGMEVLRARS